MTCKIDYFTTKSTESTESTKKKLKNKTFDTIFQFCHVEFHQYIDLHPGQFSIGQPLGVTNAPQFLDMLRVDNRLVLDKKIHSVSTIEPHLLVLYWQC